MLRTRNPVQALSPSDRDSALEVCAQDLPANVFVAARILEGVLVSQPGTLLGHKVDGQLTSLCWSSANLVPVEADETAIGFYADRVRRWRRHCASILGPAEQVSELWRQLAGAWGPARAVRPDQPLMSSHDQALGAGHRAGPARAPGTGRRGRARHARRRAHVRGRDRLRPILRQRRRVPLRPALPDRPRAHLGGHRGRPRDLQGGRGVGGARLRPAPGRLARALTCVGRGWPCRSWPPWSSR